MVRSCVLGVFLAAVVVATAGSPGAARASTTCAAYPNQAAAQRAADTRDGDGDGVYCESLPCPCLKPGQNRPSSGHRHRSGRRPRTLGRPVLLGPLPKKTGCHVRGALPDLGCTPGAVYPKATRSVICQPGYSASVRNVSRPSRDAVYAAYDFVHAFDGYNGELDHLVSLELGGSNSRANLFPESASPRPGSAEKDRLENELSRLVCRGRISLRFAQRLIATDWLHARQWVNEHFADG